MLTLRQGSESSTSSIRMAKMKGSWIEAALVITSLFSSSEAVLPGMKSRVTQTGLDFVRHVAVRKAESMVVGQAIPSRSGGGTGYDYDVYNMRVTDFEVSASQIHVRDVESQSVGLEIYADVSTTVAGDWDVTIVWFYEKDGTFSASISGATATILVSLSATHSSYTGKVVPMIQYEGCSFDPGHVHVHLSDNPHWSEKASNMLWDQLNENGCEYIRSAIDEQLREKLEELRMEMLFYHGQFELDYSLMTSPQSISGSIDLSHKGEIDSVKFPHTPPGPTKPIRTGAKVSKMFYVWISDFLVNTAGFAFHKAGMLHYTVTDKDVPPTMSMNTSGFPINFIFPEVTKLYPGMLMQFVAQSAAPPEVDITADKVTSYAYAYIDAYVTKPNNKPTYLFKLSSNISLSFKLGIQKQNLTWVSQLESVGLDLVNSTISGLKINKLKTMLKPAIKNFVIPKLNKQGTVGYPIPSFKGFHAMNTSVTQANEDGSDLAQRPKRQLAGYLEVGTDLGYRHEEFTIRIL